MSIHELIKLNKDNKLALYGLGTETERFIKEYGENLHIIGLLDGYKEDGNIFGYPITSIDKAICEGISLIIVIARPGSCKAITKRIGDICRSNNIALFDVRGKNLLVAPEVSYIFPNIKYEKKDVLYEKIDKSDIVSFDLFDTLITRKVYSYTDIFELVNIELIKKGIAIPDFCKLRLSSEKEMSYDKAPTLEKIYEKVLNVSGIKDISAKRLAELEFKIDLSTITTRKAVCDIINSIIQSGKKAIITTDCYYRKEQIEKLLDAVSIIGYDKLFISCEYNTSKTQHLFDEVSAYANGSSILHIGDDEVADIEAAAGKGFDTYRLYNGMALYDSLGGLGTEDKVGNLSDRLRLGLIISRLFNDPFCIEACDGKVSVETAEDIGYVFCGSIITDFTLWIKRVIKEQNINQIFFCARDGYLIKKLYQKIDSISKSIYFLTSRTAAIRAGMKDAADIEYVDSMKFFGSSEEALRRRFGIDLIDSETDSRNKAILDKACKQRLNYKKYISGLNLSSGEIAMFDFVAKGTTQLYLERLFEEHMKGFYFLQLEPEFMADKGLDIKPFYKDEEKNDSAIYDNYYILETVLTAPFPQVLEIDDDGNPVYDVETRSKTDIRCFEKIQAGVEEFFDDFICLLPEDARIENKQLDEVFLTFVNYFKILDEDFLAFKVEDPFFGRMTDIKNVI